MGNWNSRSAEAEIIDQPGFGGKDLIKNLREIDRINQQLGGFGYLIQRVKEIIELNNHKNVWISDLGCGSGYLLRELHQHFPEHDYYGIDHHPEIVDFARSQTSEEIIFQKVDAHEYVQSLDDRHNHIVICSLFLHHFSDEQIVELLNSIKQKRAILVVNDLQRSRWAYLLFQFYGLITSLSSVSTSDGLLSIKKGFRRPELLEYAELSGTTIHRLELKPLFRWHMEVSA